MKISQNFHKKRNATLQKELVIDMEFNGYEAHLQNICTIKLVHWRFYYGVCKCIFNGRR
jgi:hypothetical protein